MRSNICGQDTVSHVLSVKICPDEVNNVTLPHEMEVTLYPNPDSGSFSIEIAGSELEDVHMSIADATGRKVKEINIIANKPIPVTIDLPPGVYFLSISDSYNTCYEKLVIIR